MAERGNKEWAKIAIAYDEVITKTPIYEQSMRNMAAEVEMIEAHKVLDLGCGTGELVTMLTRKGIEVVGVDFEPLMIEYAERNVRERGDPSKARFYVADATRFNKEGDFDAVVSHNVLFNIPEGMRYLVKAQQLLNKNGSLIIASPYEQPDFDQTKATMEDIFRQKGELEQKRDLIDIVFDVNKNFSTFRPYPRERLEKILIDYVGFDRITTSDETFLHNFLITAQKAPQDHKFTFIITDDMRERGKGFGLRYFWLHDWHQAIPPNNEYVFARPEEWSGISEIVKDAKGKVVGFLNMAQGTESLANNKECYHDLQKRFDKLVCLSAFVTTPWMQGKELGMYIASSAFQHLINEGVQGVYAEGMRPSSNMMRRFGGTVTDKVMRGVYSHDNGSVDSMLSFIDLTDRRSQDIIKSYNRRFQGRFGAPVITTSSGD